jgi:retron-type reverse transcriptase
MKTHKNLFNEICSFQNLWYASRKAKRGKSSFDYVQRFEHLLETELLQLRRELLACTYVPGHYKEFIIVEPKVRMISAAPYRDRVVHHALCNVIEPLFNRSFLLDSYANQAGKGVHRAVDRFQWFAQKYRYVLKCDIRKYFPSIDHSVLKSIIRKKIACARTLSLIDTIIDRSNNQDPVHEYFPGDDLFTPFERRRGLPIGNLTSQFFANVYLNQFDHYMKEEQGANGFIRYVDDFVMFADDKEELYRLRSCAESFLASLRLCLHQTKSLIHKNSVGVQYLGYRIFPDYRLLKNESIVRYKRKIKKMVISYCRGETSLERVRSSIHGWIGHATNANTFRLRKAVLESAVFTKG